MQTNTSHHDFERLQVYLSSHSIARALDILESAMRKHSLYDYQADIEAIRTSYNYMFSYMAAGGTDDGRAGFVSSAAESIQYLADRMTRDIETMTSPGLYYAKVRALRLEDNSFSSLLQRYTSAVAALSLAEASGCALSPLHAEKEQALINIFNYVWVTFPMTGDEYAELTDVVCDPDRERELQSQLIVGLLLGALQFHEPMRIETLMDIYDRTADAGIRARALMSLLTAMYAHRQRIASDSRIARRWHSRFEDGQDLRNLRTAVLDIAHTLDTERINKSLKEDLIPAMKKIQPKLSQLFGNINAAEGEYNPEWEELLQQSGLDKKMQELNELQSEGADLMMFAFSNLKNFGFFNEVSNWFLPFDPEHSQLAGQNLIPSLLEIISAPGMMCDSDKYSLALSMGRMPERQRDMLISQLAGQEEQIRDAMDKARLLSSTTDNIFKEEAARYIRDMNRFLKLFREKKQFTDILRHPFTVSQIPFAGETIMNDPDSVELLGEFYLKRKYYSDAAEMFSALEKTSHADPALYEKLGYCLQQDGRPDEAMTYYRKAELFNPDSLWLIKHIASLSRTLKAYGDAIEYYSKALKREPENISLLMNCANTSVEAERYDEALRLYYKVNYLKPDHLNSLRAIAWVEFLNGNHDKSIEMHEKVLMHPSSNDIDLINAGHAEMLANDIARAMEYYRRAIGSDAGTGLKKWADIYAGDRDAMVRAGCDPLTIDLVKDRIIHDCRQ